jgi:flagellar assembly factor FliW
MEDELPDLVFARPMPGFPELTRFILVRLGAPGRDGDGESGGRGGEDGGGDGEGGGGDGEGGGGDGDGDQGLLYELRSLERPEVRFLVAVPTPFFPDYTIELDEAACTELDLHDAGDALVLVVLTVGPEAGGATANLLAPVVVNARTRHAAQVILSGSDWPVRAVVA